MVSLLCPSPTNRQATLQCSHRDQIGLPTADD